MPWLQKTHPNKQLVQAIVCSVILHVVFIITCQVSIFSFYKKKPNQYRPINVSLVLEKEKITKSPVKKPHCLLKPLVKTVIKKTVATPKQSVKSIASKTISPKKPLVSVAKKIIIPKVSQKVTDNKNNKHNKVPPKQDDFAKLLKDLSSKKTHSTPKLSITQQEIDMVYKQIYQAWRIPLGLQNIHKYKIILSVFMNPNRTIRQVKLLKDSHYNNDSTYKVLAESALRAMSEFKYQPLLLPVDKYKLWQEIELIFDPSEVV